jgi:multidrug resistance efflux pump
MPIYENKILAEPSCEPLRKQEDVDYLKLKVTEYAKSKTADYSKLLDRRVSDSDKKVGSERRSCDAKKSVFDGTRRVVDGTKRVVDGTKSVAENENLPVQQFISTWLSWQCRMVSGLIRGALFLPTDDGKPGRPVAQWPQDGDDLSLLSTITATVLTERRSTVQSNEQYGAGEGHVCDVVACPLLMNGELVAVVAVMMSSRSLPQRHAVTQLLEWGLLWLENLLRQQAAAKQETSEATLKLIAAALCHKALQASVIEVVNRMSEHLKCERVSLGLRRGLSIRIEAVSHMVRIDGRNQLMRCIEAVMEEAVDQHCTQLYPPELEVEQPISRAHAELVKHQGKEAICTVPLFGRSGYLGAITCERDAERPFDTDSRKFCESVAKLFGPIVEIKLLEEQSLLARSNAAARAWFAGLLGPGRFKFKLMTALVLVFIIFMFVAQGEHRVSAPALLQGAVRQLLVAPQDGYVKEGLIRSGAMVQKGDLLATLEDTTLQLERKKLQSEKKIHQQGYQQALAKRERANLGILLAEIEKVEAEIRLVDDKISRTQLRSPIDGMVISGDLSQSQGSPVRLGEVLFDVAPLNNYRVILEVDEHDIARLETNQSGHIVMSALPDKSFVVNLESVISVAQSEGGRNFFRVQGVLVEPSPQLRPGMQGVAKIELGQKKLIWVWGHGVYDRLRLWAWSLGLIT